MPKYRNAKTDGFDSKREARRYQELLLLERIGEITELDTQVSYILIPKQDGERSCTYKADFRYREQGRLVVEDVKSKITKTPVYVVKRKLMLWIHKIRIRETE